MWSYQRCGFAVDFFACQNVGARNAVNQTVIPNTCLQPLTQAQTIYATNTERTNGLAEGRLVVLLDVLIKILLAFPVFLRSSPSSLFLPSVNHM